VMLEDQDLLGVGVERLGGVENGEMIAGRS
jgi:hypothetical protein